MVLCVRFYLVRTELYLTNSVQSGQNGKTPLWSMLFAFLPNSLKLHNLTDIIDTGSRWKTSILHQACSSLRAAPVFLQLIKSIIISSSFLSQDFFLLTNSIFSIPSLWDITNWYSHSLEISWIQWVSQQNVFFEKLVAEMTLGFQKIKTAIRSWC